MIYIAEELFAFENKLITNVKLGKSKNTKNIVASLPFNVENIKGTRVYLHSINALLRKAAENGGAPILTVAEKSKEFIFKIENMTNPSHSQSLIYEMVNAYCGLVDNYSKSHYSTPVSRAIIRIDSDLRDDLSLKALAEFNSINAGYFSSLFKKETGLTLTDYVNRKRIASAKEQLQSTRLQIKDITNNVGLKDANYFIKLFKKYEGMTPTAYREKQLG
ncbi:MAG: helix-turn-helix transcriptional regulator [Clostridia bacterium]|nr:helix-turn-helix transcriptional regulator [Clostridia bacterium]